MRAFIAFTEAESGQSIFQRQIALCSPCRSVVPLPLAEVSIPILQEGIPTIQVVPAPAQFGLNMPHSDELNNNEVQVSSPNLPASVMKRGRKPDSASVKAMKAQVRNEGAEKIKGVNLKEEVKKRRTGI